MEEENVKDIPLRQPQYISECTTLIVEAGLIIIINITFLMLLHRRRRAINWKSIGFVANVAVSDLLCSVCLIAMLGNLLDWWSNDDLVEDVIELLTTYSIFITVINYSSLFFVQYFSIKKPIFYQTRCTRRIFIYVIIGQWLLVSVYIIAKAVIIDEVTVQFNLSIGELVLMALTTIFNIATYSYVLYVSSMQTMQKLARRQDKEQENRRKERENGKRNEINQNRKEAESENQNDKEDQNQNQTQIQKEGQDQSQNRIQNEQNKKSFWAIAKPVFKILLIDYRVTVTAGLHLIVYVVTLTPIWVVSVLVASGTIPASAHSHKFSTQHPNIYACRSPACRVTFYIWYLRAIIDPLLQIAREHQLARELKKRVKKYHTLLRRGNDQDSMSKS